MKGVWASRNKPLALGSTARHEGGYDPLLFFLHFKRKMGLAGTVGVAGRDQQVAGGGGYS